MVGSPGGALSLGLRPPASPACPWTGGILCPFARWPRSGRVPNSREGACLPWEPGTECSEDVCVPVRLAPEPGTERGCIGDKAGEGTRPRLCWGTPRSRTRLCRTEGGEGAL